FGPTGIVVGIAMASAIAYGIAFRLVHRKLSIHANVPWLPAVARYAVVILPSLVALAVLLSADVVLAKHFFSPKLAGEYAVVAAIGRAVYWAASGIAVVLFPKVTFA